MTRLRSYDRTVISRLGRGAIAVVFVVIGSLMAVGGVAYAATSARPVVVAIGDSIMEGHGLSAGQAWIATIAKQDDWRFTNLASDGSGFLKVGNKGDTFADQARAAIALHPSVIVLAGSSNDLGEPDAALATATGKTIASIRAALPHVRIIAVSAIWGATAVPAQLNDIDNQVQAAIAAVGGEYLNIGQPLSGHPELMQSDAVHPTAAGQRVLARSVSAAFLAAHGGL
jgi:acyl-CoA thioesterase-1